MVLAGSTRNVGRSRPGPTSLRRSVGEQRGLVLVGLRRRQRLRQAQQVPGTRRPVVAVGSRLGEAAGRAAVGRCWSTRRGRRRSTATRSARCAASGVSPSSPCRGGRSRRCSRRTRGPGGIDAEVGQIEHRHLVAAQPEREATLNRVRSRNTASAGPTGRRDRGLPDHGGRRSIEEGVAGATAPTAKPTPAAWAHPVGCGCAGAQPQDGAGVVDLVDDQSDDGPEENSSKTRMRVQAEDR